MTNILLCSILPVLVAVQVHKHIGFIQFNEPVPAFISNLSLKAQFDYKMLLENETIPMKTKSAQLKAWASTYNVTVS